MIVQFNRENATDTNGEIQIKGYTAGEGGDTPCEVIFKISYDNLDRYVGDYRGYWSRDLFIRADENWPMITSACAYAMHRLPAILSLIEPNYVNVMPEDFPTRVTRDAIAELEAGKGAKLETVEELMVDLTEETLKEVLVDMRKALKELTPEEIVYGVIAGSWGLELVVEGDRGQGTESFDGNKALAQDIVRELKDAGYL